MKKQRHGFVLVSVLWVVALLTIITLSYHHRARLEVQASRYSLDAAQARMAARGAVERGIIDLRNKSLLDAYANTAGSAVGGPVAHLGQPWARGGDLFGAGGILKRDETFADDVVLYTIEDLDRYVNMNTAPEEVVENLPGVNRPLARKLHFRRAGTDEAGAARGAAAPFQDVAEIRRLDGISEDEWRGTSGKPGLRDLVTTQGDGRINVNTATIDVLRVLPGVGDQIAGDILSVRNGADGVSGTTDDKGWSAWDAFATDTGVQGDALQSLKRLCKFDSSYFKITGTATRRGGKIRSACAAVYRLSGGSEAPTLVSWTEESLGTQ